MCFFFRTLEKFNKQFGGLFGKGGGEQGIEPDEDTRYFEKNFGWVYNAKKVADFENVPLNHVWDFGVFQFLNDLTYLKEFEDNERKMIRHARDSEQ
jgi:hypothetical protein